MEKIVSLKKCKDQKAIGVCFACTSNGYCKALKDTRTIPCPFFKTRDQVMAEDPNYFKRGECNE